jgi:hypothetical protein
MIHAISTYSLNNPIWLSLKNFAIDSPNTDLTFVKRLARENGWRLNFAERVFDEYKKFIYLAVTAGHQVTPSDQVDQVWHLHLAYTQSYWINLCEGILKQHLHHGPTKGGRSEDAKYYDWYSRTLASYRQMFGHHPPSDIWPSPEERFNRKNRFVRLNSNDYWLIKKPKLDLNKASASVGALLFSGLAVAACTAPGGLNIVPPLIFVFVIAIILIAVIKAIPRPQSGAAPRERKRSDSSCGEYTHIDSPSGCGSGDCDGGSSGCGSSGCGGGGCGGS